MKLISYFLYGSLMFALCFEAASAQSLTVNVNARVTAIYDPGNVLGGEAIIGQTVTGRYTYETMVPDQIWDPSYGQYLQSPAQGKLLLPVGSLVFESDNDVPSWSFRVEVQPSEGSMQIISPLNKPLTNGASVETFNVVFSDPSGRTFVTDALPAVAPNVADLMTKNVFLAGQLNGNWYNVSLEITSADAAGINGGLAVSPASSIFAPQQRFDAALLLPPGSPIRSVQATRGGMLLPTQCNSISFTAQGNVVVLCTDAHALLQYGSGNIEWRVERLDDSVLIENVSWELVP